MTDFINCVGGTNGDNPTELTRVDFDIAIRAMLSMEIKGEPIVYGASPMRYIYVARCDIDLIDEVEAVTGFIRVTGYPSCAGVFKQEWGCVGNMRIYVGGEINAKSSKKSHLGNDVFEIKCVSVDGTKEETKLILRTTLA